MINAQATLCVLAGILLTTQGLIALGLVPRRLRPWLGGGGGAGCLAGSFVGPFLSSPRSTDVLLAGVLTGFLPCGLVYGYLALATSSANIWQGLLTMSLFGAGTGPLMILAGAGSSLLSVTLRRNLLKVAALCVCLTGLISIGRGIHFVQLSAGQDLTHCPFCSDSG